MTSWYVYDSKTKSALKVPFSRSINPNRSEITASHPNATNQFPNQLARAAADLFKILGYTDVAILHPNGNYGQAWRDDFIEYSQTVDIKGTAFAYKFGGGVADFQKVLNTVKSFQFNVVLFISVSSRDTPHLAEAAHFAEMSGPGKLWVFSGIEGSDPVDKRLNHIMASDSFTNKLIFGSLSLFSTIQGTCVVEEGEDES